MFIDEEKSTEHTRISSVAVRDSQKYNYCRFMQIDPIGYDDGLNWYNYVGGDPVNGTDPTGLDHSSPKLPCESNETFVGFDHGGQAICNPYVIGPDIVVTGSRQPPVVITGSLTVTPGPASGYPAATISYPQNAFVRNPGIPPNSKPCSAGGLSFRAPSDFDPKKIMNSGYWGGLPGAYFSVAHYGTYDFQRSVGADGGTTFYRQYTPVSNMAVGFYLAGAGYSRDQATSISNNFANSMSSNGATTEQADFRNLAYDVVEGKAKITCYP